MGVDAPAGALLLFTHFNFDFFILNPLGFIGPAETFVLPTREAAEKRGMPDYIYKLHFYFFKSF